MANYKLMIKARFSNLVHRMLDKNHSKKRSNYERFCDVQNIKKLSDKEKAQILDQVINVYQASSRELRAAMVKRREKNRVAKLRIARGVPSKRGKKTSKQDWENKLKTA